MASFDQSTDSELVEAIADPARRDQAYRALYERYSGRLMAFVRSRFPQLAFDVTQETWLRAWTMLGMGEVKNTNIRAWLFRVSQNLCLDRVRGRKWESLPDEIPDRYSPVDEIENLESNAERARKLAKCVEQLARKKPDHAEAVQAWQRGEDPEEFAQRMNISVDNYYQRKKRALDALGRCVEQLSP